MNKYGIVADCPEQKLWIFAYLSVGINTHRAVYSLLIIAERSKLYNTYRLIIRGYYLRSKVDNGERVCQANCSVDGGHHCVGINDYDIAESYSEWFYL